MKRKKSILRRRAWRLSLITTLGLALILVLVLGVVDAFVASRLTAGVDSHLAQRLNAPFFPVGENLNRENSKGEFDEPVLEWVVSSRGNSTAAPGFPGLPVFLNNVTTPVTENFAGGQFRFSGKDLNQSERLVVAANLVPVSNAIGALLLGEGVALPVVLLLIFGSAFLVSLRLADPIEEMRKKQLAFTADASHELRTPLSVIVAETALAKKGSKAEMEVALEHVENEATRMRKIVNDLLWLARFDAEPKHGEDELVNLGVIVRMEIERFEAIAKERGITLSGSISKEDELTLLGKSDWFNRVVSILLDNACRYSKPEGVVSVQVERIGRKIKLSVSNGGAILKEEELEHLFNRYRRGTEEGEGTGLGLAIADAIVKASNGSWEVRAPEDGGAIFAIVWNVH